MARKIYITEKQYKMALKEGVLPGNQKINVNATNVSNVPEENVKMTKDAIKKSGGKVENFSIHAPNPGSKDTEIVSKNTDNNNYNNAELNEENFLTKKELQENRLKVFKKNSQLFTVKDFLNTIKN